MSVRKVPLTARVVDVGLYPSFPVTRYLQGRVRAQAVTHIKGGWILLDWESQQEPGTYKLRTIQVTKARAVQAMAALAVRERSN